ncbi:Acetylcholine receptor subunit beta-like 2 [Folsomia candida]|uniref:Acetylcholine receptor subunit beta-like 2 n=1 Tax=Folsomia candida TaxID=158441 RepID=A0A226EXH1_FOLCA|nr:Acetylcholine receptor subunit beta-like 2 [Folsomia candida]
MYEFLMLFTMVLVTLSISVTVLNLNVHFRSPSTHKMSPWVKKVFLELMPRFLCMKRPEYRPIYAYEGDFTATSATAGNNDYGMNFGTGGAYDTSPRTEESSVDHSRRMKSFSDDSCGGLGMPFSPEISAALKSVQFIAQHIKEADKDNEVIEDWKYVAMVLDRLFLWIFTLACVLGTCLIILQAPSLYDDRSPIDQVLSEIYFQRTSVEKPKNHVTQ